MQKYYTEPARQIPVAAETDVLVVGSGPAGFSAAVNAARQGAGVMLIESAGAVGGVSTSGMMSHFTGSVKSRFYEELLSRMAERNEGGQKGVRTVTIDTENMGIRIHGVIRVRDFRGSICAALTGDQCTLTNIRVAPEN